MAHQKFEALRLTDRQTIEAFRSIAKTLGHDDAEVSITIAERFAEQRCSLAQVDEDPVFKELLTTDTAAVQRIVLVFRSLGANIQVFRHPKTVDVEIHYPDGGDATLLLRLSKATHEHLRGFDSSESIRRVLGDEVSEFHTRHETTLSRLESLSARLVEQNEAYRRRLDEEHEAFKKIVAEEAQQREEALAAEYTTKHEALNQREQALEARAQDLDDRSSRHVRREIRKDLKKALGDRAQLFVLTQATTRKRLPIHALFAALLVASAALTGYTLFTAPPSHDDPTFWFYISRLIIGVLGFVGSILFYIRWSDHWFRQHADEEFRFKRLELDIDRASWVVETAMEWKGEKGDEIPRELVERLTNGLFTDEVPRDRPRHPSEDALSILLRSVKTLRMSIPGLGEAELDRESLQRLSKKAP